MGVRRADWDTGGVSPTTSRCLVAAATAVVVAVAAGTFAGGAMSEVAVALAAFGAVAGGWVVVLREPRSPVGPALAWCSASIGVVYGVDILAASYFDPDPLPFAWLANRMVIGAWPANLAGLLALLLVFPDGPRPGWLSRATPVVFGAASLAILINTWGPHDVDGNDLGPGPAPWRLVLLVASLVGIGVAMALAVASLVIRYRRGAVRQRQQIRWLILAGAAVVVMLAVGWGLEIAGAPLAVAYTPFLLGIVVLVPAAVGIAVIRYDLFDIDRLLSASSSWAITLLASATIFGCVVFAVGHALSARTGLGSATAAFAAALALLPLHRLVASWVGRVVDRDRHVSVAAIERFAADVRAGRRQPEEVEKVLREVQRDPDLAVQVVRPDGQWVRLDGTPVAKPQGFALEASGDVVARISLGWDSNRARRRLADLAKAAWVPIEVSRLRLVLHDALTEVEASRLRLVEAAAAERRRLERDLHDGAQQRIVATGMRLRGLQRRLASRGEDADAADVDTAVTELEETVTELRELAHGVRPVRLSDGLGPALASVRDASPVPLTLEVDEPADLDEARRLTAYLVVAEAVTNALKHAAANRILVTVGPREGGVEVEVVDDGVGGVSAGGLTSLRDRVLSVGGSLRVESPAGGGTRVEAKL